VLAKTKLLTMIAKRQIHPTTGHEGREWSRGIALLSKFGARWG
jgi:hypothetical protein